MGPSHRVLRALKSFDLWGTHAELDFSDGSDGKESACNTGDPGLIPGLGRSPGEENGYLVHSCYLPPTLAWRIPWTEEPGGLQFTES